MKKTCTLFCSLFFTAASFAQIPNASFETWTHVASGGVAGYDMPASWGNANSYTSVDSTYTCEKGVASPSAGSFSLKLTTKTVTAFGLSAAVPGIAVTGNVNYTPPSSYGVSGGYPFTSRPANLTGEWQYMASGADHGQVVVFLFKWNTALNRRDTVSFTNYSVPGLPAMAMAWVPFSIPLTYQSGKTPDSAMIVLSSSTATPVAGSYLYIDTLSFTGSVPSGVVTVANDDAATSLFPNPATGNTTIYYYSLFSGELAINVTDITGKTVKGLTTPVIAGSNNIPLSLSGLIKGIYTVGLSNGLGTSSLKLVVN